MNAKLAGETGRLDSNHLGKMVSCPNNTRDYRWSFEENRKYVGFLEEHPDMIKLSKKKKLFGFYLLMSRAVQSKDNIQCRTHHVKMKKVHQTERNIIKFFKKKIEESKQESSSK